MQYLQIAAQVYIANTAMIRFEMHPIAQNIPYYNSDEIKVDGNDLRKTRQGQKNYPFAYVGIGRGLFLQRPVSIEIRIRFKTKTTAAHYTLEQIQ